MTKFVAMSIVVELIPKTADSDMICGNKDTCPYDFENDIDGDALCKRNDKCPYDPQNDYDKDGICEYNCDFKKNAVHTCTVDYCPHDPENDADSDRICGNVDRCPH